VPVGDGYTRGRNLVDILIPQITSAVEELLMEVVEVAFRV
jgi:hypothetical protein